MSGKQVTNGRAFEYALAWTYAQDLGSRGVEVNVLENGDWADCRKAFKSCTKEDQDGYVRAARQTVETLCRLEPGLTRSAFKGDVLNIKLMPTAAGKQGDVRDVVFWREKNGKSVWEIGISAKNNHDAVKHSRISPTIDFGKEWLDIPCSTRYMETVGTIFKQVDDARKSGYKTWKDLGREFKVERVYKPLLEAFKTEFLQLCSRNEEKVVVRRLLEYLVGRYPFYKVIKHDRQNVVVVKAFNFIKGMGQAYGKMKPDVVPEAIHLPSRVIEMECSHDSAMLIMDEGWQLKFRIHNAEKELVNSLKWDVQMVGNPPVLFSQYLFGS